MHCRGGILAFSDDINLRLSPLPRDAPRSSFVITTILQRCLYQINTALEKSVRVQRTFKCVQEEADAEPSDGFGTPAPSASASHPKHPQSALGDIDDMDNATKMGHAMIYCQDNVEVLRNQQILYF